VKRGPVRINPFAELPIAKSVNKRERVLSDAEIAQIWRAAGVASSPYGTIIRLLILTGQRRGEVAGMAWNEISDDLTTWSLPPERTKNGTAHTVPLSAPARNLLTPFLPDDASEWRAASRLVFPGAAGSPFAGWSKAKAALDKTIIEARANAIGAGGKAPGPLVPWSVHDLRRVLEGEEESEREKHKSKWSRLVAVAGAKTIAADIVSHFEERRDAMGGGKGMIVAMSRRIAVSLHDEIAKLQPSWVSTDDAKGVLKIVMTGSASDPIEFKPHIRRKTRCRVNALCATTLTKG